MLSGVMSVASPSFLHSLHHLVPLQPLRMYAATQGRGFMMREARVSLLPCVHFTLLPASVSVSASASASYPTASCSASCHLVGQQGAKQWPPMLLSTTSLSLRQRLMATKATQGDAQPGSGGNGSAPTDHDQEDHAGPSSEAKGGGRGSSSAASGGPASRPKPGEQQQQEQAAAAPRRPRYSPLHYKIEEFCLGIVPTEGERRAKMHVIERYTPRHGPLLAGLA